MQTLGSKGELKLTQCIRGSGLPWTDAYHASHTESHMGIVKSGGGFS